MLINGGGGGRYQRIPVTPGDTYTATFFAKKDGSERTIGGLIFRDVSGNMLHEVFRHVDEDIYCLLYTSPSPRDQRGSRMPSSA